MPSYLFLKGGFTARLTLNDVCYTYEKGGNPVLNNIDLDFCRPGVISLVGPNGSGKSTLLKCINNILKPYGDIILNGRRIREMHPSDIARKMGYVPQDFLPAFPVTVFDMVLLGRRPYLGWNPSQHDIDVVTESISVLGLEDFVLRPVTDLSGGERQKVLIATVLSQEPEVLLLDEPTSKLDIRHQMEVMKFIRNITMERGLLVLIAIHDLNLASQYSDKMVMLSKGRVFLQGEPKEVLTRSSIRTVYNVNVAIHRHGNLRHIVPVEDDDMERMEKPESVFDCGDEDEFNVKTTHEKIL